MIEEEPGVFVDDDALQPDTTVGELIALVEADREAKRRRRVVALAARRSSGPSGSPSRSS